jgi:GNAT superfamily N-acetyltransferase
VRPHLIYKVRTKNELLKFVQVAYRLYRNNPYWYSLPESVEIKNLENELPDAMLFYVEKSGKPLGRIAIFPRHNIFGFFECVDNLDIARLLFEKVRECCTAQIRGPVNPFYLDPGGILIDGFKGIPAFMTPYNFPYYARLFEGCELKVLERSFGYRLSSLVKMPEKILKASKEVLTEGRITLRPIRFSALKKPSSDEFDKEVENLMTVYNRAWAQHQGFAPLEKRQALALAKKLLQLIDPGLVLFAEDKGEPVGIAICIKDLGYALVTLRRFPWPFNLVLSLRQRISCPRIRVWAVGVVKEYRKMGIGSALYTEIANRAIKAGYREADLSQVGEKNIEMRRAIEAIGAKVYRTYATYTLA